MNRAPRRGAGYSRDLRKDKGDVSRVGAGSNDQHGFEFFLVAGVDQINAGVDIRVANAAAGSGLRAPEHGIPARQLRRRFNRRQRIERAQWDQFLRSWRLGKGRCWI
jgi:hypothetical protein